MPLKLGTPHTWGLHLRLLRATIAATAIALVLSLGLATLPSGGTGSGPISVAGPEKAQAFPFWRGPYIYRFYGCPAWHWVWCPHEYA
jgi:hypothetical protein